MTHPPHPDVYKLAFLLMGILLALLGSWAFVQLVKAVEEDLGPSGLEEMDHGEDE